MANQRKKIINIFDGGVKTSSRDSNPDTSDGAQVIKGFDIYKDPKKLIPMQSWQDFTTTAEKAYGIRAMGGIGDTVYGVGSALTNWYGQAWAYRLRVDINAGYLINPSMPLHLDLSLLPSDFWTHSESTLADFRVTDKNNNTVATMIENLDYANMTGDAWIGSNAVSVDTVITSHKSFLPTNNLSVEVSDNASFDKYAFAIPVTLTGQTFNYFKTKVAVVGSPSDIIVDLYTDSAGSPGTLVQNLGTIKSEYVAPYVSVGNMGDREFIFNDVVLSGNYHIVMHTVTASTGNSPYYLYSFDGATPVKRATNVGLTAWTDIDTTTTPYFTLGYATYTQPYFYIYYGNPTASQISHGSPSFQYTSGGQEVFTPLSARWCYTFGETAAGQTYDNKYYSNSAGILAEEGFETAPLSIIDGLVGKAIRTNGLTISTDNDDEVALTANDISLSIMVKFNSNPASFAYYDSNGGWQITGNAATGGVTFYVNGADGSATKTISANLEVGKWYFIDCEYNNDYYVYINGVQYLNTDNNGDYDGDPVNNTINISTTGDCYVALPWGFNNDNLSSDIIRTKLYNFTQSDFYTIGSEVLKTSISLQYGGTQLYQKSITSGDWTDLLEGGRPVRTLTGTPENGFIDDTGTYFPILSNGSQYLAKRDTRQGLDDTHLLLGVPIPSQKTVMQSEVAINGTAYFNGFYSYVSQGGDPGDLIVFTVTSGVESMIAWRTYLAVANTYRNKGFISTWDLVADSQAVEKINTGVGTIRILGNASDTLFCVIDNFIDDAVKSGNKPTMEIRQYVGNGTMQTTHVIEIPAVITDYDDTWERAVSNFKISRNTQTLFYARLPTNEAGTTFNEGFWSVGLNSRGQLSLALQIDTEGLGMPENVFAFAQQVFFIAKDGGIHRLSDNTYNNIALLTTQKMNEGNTEVEKKLIGVEIVTEPIEADQTISVYYRVNGSTNRTKIFDMTLDNSFNGNGLSYETTYDIDENNLPNYQEIEFDIESTGGKSAVLELNYKYEYLSNVV